MKRRPTASDSIRAMTATTANPYLRDAVLTATPEQLQLMLYDGAVRFALQGRDALVKKDFETAYLRLTRAQNIVIEMLNGLNYDVNADLCQRMASIYNFIYRKLVDACVQRKTDDVDDAVRVLRMERETWQILVDKVNRERNRATSDESTLTASTSAGFSADG